MSKENGHKCPGKKRSETTRRSAIKKGVAASGVIATPVFLGNNVEAATGGQKSLDDIEAPASTEVHDVAETDRYDVSAVRIDDEVVYVRVDKEEDVISLYEINEQHTFEIESESFAADDIGIKSSDQSTAGFVQSDNWSDYFVNYDGGQEDYGGTCQADDDYGEHQWAYIMLDVAPEVEELTEAAVKAAAMAIAAQVGLPEELIGDAISILFSAAAVAGLTEFTTGLIDKNTGFGRWQYKRASVRLARNYGADPGDTWPVGQIPGAHIDD